MRVYQIHPHILVWKRLCSWKRWIPGIGGYYYNVKIRSLKKEVGMVFVVACNYLIVVPPWPWVTRPMWLEHWTCLGWQSELAHGSCWPAPARFTAIHWNIPKKVCMHVHVIATPCCRCGLCALIISLSFLSSRLSDILCGVLLAVGEQLWWSGWAESYWGNVNPIGNFRNLYAEAALVFWNYCKWC